MPGTNPLGTPGDHKPELFVGEATKFAAAGGLIIEGVSCTDGESVKSNSDGGGGEEASLCWGVLLEIGWNIGWKPGTKGVAMADGTAGIGVWTCMVLDALGISD